MPKGLIIVESPAKSNTISKFLHHQYDVKASMGHVRDLPQKTFGIKVEKHFAPTYVIDPKKKKTIDILKEAVDKCSAVFLASDHDREGEAIAWHLEEILKQQIGGKPVHRIVFNEITQKAIKEAISHPDKIDMNKVNAQQARRILDRIVGYQVSPLLWKIISKDLSAGRVQSVALRLICEREEEIRAFVPKEYWKLETVFSKHSFPGFKASLDKWKDKKAELANETQTQEIIKAIEGKPAVLKSREDKIRSVEPLPPFITSTLQQDASRLLNFPAHKTMSLAQELYEGINLGGEHTGMITYMRTDSLRVAEEANAACSKLIAERFGKEWVHKSIRRYKNTNSAQDAHEAIRPTDPMKTPEAVAQYLSKDLLKLYTLIWQRFVATQMKPLKLRNTEVRVTIAEAEFLATGNQMEDEGFLKVWTHYSYAAGEKIDEAYKPADSLEYEPFAASQHFTTPPPRFTEASLIKELEAKGIGRPSTYAAILTTIRQRKYVFMEKKSFLPTELGIKVNCFLVERFGSIFNVKFTAEMETKLDEVEYGKAVWHEILQSYYNHLQKLISAVDIKKERINLQEETELTCDVCHQGRLVIKWGRKKQYLACSRYPECKNSKNFSRTPEGEIKIEEPKQLEENCPKCGKPLLIRKGQYGEFISCSDYPKCKYTRSIGIGVTCPECGKGDVVARRSKKGIPFYTCSTYPACKWLSNDKPVARACPQCRHPYLVEKYTKTKGTVMVCPSCKAEFHS